MLMEITMTKMMMEMSMTKMIMIKRIKFSVPLYDLYDLYSLTFDIKVSDFDLCL